MDCIEDATLPDSVDGQRILLASNLHNNEELLPHYILQLLQLIVNLPAGSSYVSIYESGSTDQTGVRTGASAVHDIEVLACGLCLCSLSSPVCFYIPVCTSVDKIWVSKLTVFSFCAAQWLDVLQQLLQILEVPSTIVTGDLRM